MLRAGQRGMVGYCTLILNAHQTGLSKNVVIIEYYYNVHCPDIY